MLAGAVGLVLLVRHFGDALTAPEPPLGAVSVVAPTAGQVDVVRHVLATLAAVVGLGYVLGRLFVRIGQPPVIGEVVAGILLGPSLLGAVWPEAMHWLIPGPDADPKGQVAAAVRAIAQVGVILYLFLVGLDLNAARLRNEARATVVITHAGIAVPFVLGASLALWLYPTYSHSGVPFTSFALFLGAALAVTAFPVLARILTDRRMEKTDLGATALGCAATDDVTAWCLVALVVGVAQARVESAVVAGVGALAFIAGMFLVVKPLAVRVSRRLDAGPLHPAAVPGVLAAVLVAALATTALGIHGVFGAFLLGVVIPHDGRLAREFAAKLKDVVVVLLLPAFFAVTGMRTEVGLLGGWQNWLICGAIILVATAGKFGGVTVAARLTGYRWRTAAALGALMNTRGLMALIVLDLGLSLGVLSPTLFAMLVLMALVTTMATAPALRWLAPATPGRHGGRPLP
ncbi:MAG TPA: cation:proton antiporter, partial [Fimbriiglobus sp.]|nr:cation:proton antiporter [Fimbriiglobus sp.]